MSPYHREKEQLYEQYRAAARDLMLQQITDLTDEPVTFTNINAAALQQAAKWPPLYAGSRAGHSPQWDWAKMVRHYRRRPRRVELAIWVDPTLCGLVLGQVSARRVVASIHLLEANPGTHPLAGSVAIIAGRFLETMAAVTECTHAAIERPVPRLVEFYKNLGFTNETTKGTRVIRLKKSLQAVNDPAKDAIVRP
jgi:hypothetical protein